MEILKLSTGRLHTNTYFVVGTDPTECFVIDPGGTADKIEQFLDQKGLKCKAILLTHVHFDHCYATAALQRAGRTVYAHKLAQKNLENNLHKKSANITISTEDFFVDHLLEDDEIFELCGLQIHIIHTPGHSSCSVCYKIGQTIFSGDTLFCSAIGRTDFPTGNYEDILKSIKEKLFALEGGDYRVLPGHEAETTLLSEKESNPYLR